MTNPLDILRGTSSNTMRKSKSTVTNVDLTIYDLAQKKADKQEDTSVMSVMLNQFSQIHKTSYTEPDGVSCLTLDDVQGFNPDDWFNIFRNRNAKENLKDGFGVKINFRGIFKTDYDRSSDIAQSKGVITQTDLFQLDLYANGGLRYAQEGYNLPRSALNFAKADINAIEVAYYHNSENKYSGSVGYGDEVVPKNNVALELDEIESYYSKNEIKKDDTVKDAMQELNLDDDPFRVTSQEYASYMLALDVDYDGVITSKEANVEFSDELRGIALSYYNEFFVE